MSKPRISDIEQALIERVRADAAIQAYGQTFETVSVRHITSDEFGNQRLIANPPAFLFLLESSNLATRDVAATTYAYSLLFRIFCFNLNLRGPVEEKRGGPAPNEIGVYTMLDDLKRVLAGARLAVTGVASEPLVRLETETLENLAPEGTVMSLQVTIETEFQP